MTLREIIDSLKASLVGIRAALQDKGVDASTHGFSDIASDIADIPAGGAYPYSGTNVTQVDSYSYTWTLADTSFDPATATSTTATSIKASVSNFYTNTTGSPTIAYGDKDIIIVQTGQVIPQYSSGAVDKVKEIGFAREYVTYFLKKTSDTSAETTRQAANIDRYILSYYNSSGTRARYAGYYGLYLAFTAPTVASATAASTYVRCTSPSLSYRVSTTYSSAANLQAVTDCQFIWTVKVYTADPGSTVGKRIERDLDTLLTNT